MGLRNHFSFFIFSDSIVVLIAFSLGSILTNHFSNIPFISLMLSSLLLLLSHHAFSSIYKLYKKSWQYASIGELIIIIKTITFSVLSVGLAQHFILQAANFRLLIVTWMFYILLIGGTRFFGRIVRNTKMIELNNKKRTLIVGAGSAGTMVARQLLQNKRAELLPIGFIDDDWKKHGLEILGIPVIGGKNQIERAVKEYEIDNIVIAIPSLNKTVLNQIFQLCMETGKKTQMIPMLEDIMTGRISINQFRDVQVEDLLGRKTIELDVVGISEFITNKVVLITGAGGSIGSEICRQVTNFNPRKVILLGHGENSIYSIKLELEEGFRHTGIQFCAEIADIQDGDKMMNVMNKHQPNVVYHAAAHKHVPLMEDNPEEAVKNNVIGTLNVANAANWNHVESFVMISTDKAVNPTSVMGATKRMAEMIIQNMNQVSKTKFVAVRFGNVLGSRGSVIPLFKKQIQKGGPVTVTDPEMVRYFMTIPEASRLTLQAGALAKGGEIFVLDMGEPVKIIDLAQNLIRLSGKNVEEIGIKFTGIRPGEKLYEELLKDDEVHPEQVYPKIYIGKSLNQDVEPIMQLLDEFIMMDTELLKTRLLYLSNHQGSSKLAVL
ncbi:FlaA1/EpsC-like NDP-sugar epimerase [Cytobacillus eiseniae]|uniref:FlaA1/EpsC-like NDP-sugar epimerase n=1 Tax=Cytobacillus eiseniae TaxID=762947 RepID=A0ABS4RG54_9BACI|nr:nucleoside-diphosphate sugar epimerase/dehydratase [Cytobacillus eiseniae]MBP2241876.1 FlaA1/EpsC-like NDP-sugar epimerase [Cytobacillus eiseniae]